MNKREYLLGFILILVGLSIGFAIGAIDYTDKWINLQQVATDNGGGTSVDETGTSGYIDNSDSSDTVVDIGPNIIGGYGFHNSLLTGGIQYNTWTLVPLGGTPIIPNTADWLIIEYQLGTAGSPQCVNSHLEFTDNPNNLVASTHIHLEQASSNGPTTTHGQALVRVVPGSGGKTWVRYYNNVGAGAPCTAEVWLAGYFD